MPLSIQARIALREEQSAGALQSQVLATLKELGVEGFEADSPEGFALEVHPAAAPIHFVLEGSGLRLQADTGTAGPGYHQFVVGFVDRLSARFGDVTVDDDSGYFASRDRIVLEQRSLAWLRDVARDVLEVHRRGGSEISLCLPEGLTYREQGLALTPTGPRSRAWMEAVLADPMKGRDFFAWWEPGFDHAYHLGAALSSMWIDVRWRAPLDAIERRKLGAALGHLEEAYSLSPTSSYPWAAWSELFTFVGEESLRATRAHIKAEALREKATIGYRRWPVRVQLSGGWSIEIPGEMREKWDQRDTFVAWDAQRTLWFNSMTAPSGYSTQQTLDGLPPLEGSTEVLEMNRGPLKGAVRFETDPADPQGRRQLAHAHAASGEHAAIGSFVIADEASRAFVLECWGTLDHQPIEGRNEPRALR